VKISIPLKRDSFNSCPTEYIEFTVYDELISLTLSDSGKERDIEFNKSDFVKLLKLIGE
jgi:hypothetical protein